MGAKLIFNELEKNIIIITSPVNEEIFIDVKKDLYSDGKKFWTISEHLRKFDFPIQCCGGNPLPGTTITLPPTFFLSSEWKIKPYEATHRLILFGDIYSVDGSDPVLNTTGNYNVHVSILRV